MRDPISAGAVHGDVAVALQQTHEAADLLDRRPLFGTSDQRQQSTLVKRMVPSPDLLEEAARRGKQLLGVRVDPLQGPANQAQEVVAQPGNASELGPMGDLMQGEPQPELAGRETVAALDRHHIRPHVVDDVLVLRLFLLDQKLVVLAQHPGGHPAEH